MEDSAVDSLGRIAEISYTEEELPVSAIGSGEAFQMLRTDGSELDAAPVSLQR